MAEEKGVLDELKLKKLISLLLIIVLIFSVTAVASAADDSSGARVIFKAGEPDQNGLFNVSLTIHDATFNTFQFALWYDKTTVVPVDASGRETSAFSDFATREQGNSWLSTVGTKVDLTVGLIEFAGYVTPGSTVTTDGAAGKPGKAVIGSSGVSVFNFRFKKLSDADVIIRVAESGKTPVYGKSLPQGAALFDAGIDIPLTVYFSFPERIGKGSSMIPERQSTQAAMTVKERLANTIALQIGNYGAAVGGALVSIDSDNPNVHPYIDENSRTMVPARFVAERLGASVDWNAAAQKVTIKSGDRTIQMTIGSKSYTVNGVSYVMDTEPVIKSGWGRTMVPIRFISESLGRAVEWDAKNQLVIITDKSNPWQSDRDAEKQATQSILFVISNLVRGFSQ